MHKSGNGTGYVILLEFTENNLIGLTMNSEWIHNNNLHHDTI